LSALALAVLPVAAHAQVSFSGSVESDYRFRGLSLSNGRPVLALAVAYDHPSGLYGGVSVLGQDTAHDGARLLGVMEYAGYAFRRTASGPSFDIGVDNETYDQYGARESSISYSEVYAGVTVGGISSHIYYSPDYFRKGAALVYASLDGAYRVNDDWRLTAHGGASTPMGYYAAGNKHERYDLRLGVSRQFRNLEAHVAWTGYWPGPATSSPASRPAVVVGASVFF
jgi:uncharacterized protein (TIGR02001 family)